MKMGNHNLPPWTGVAGGSFLIVALFFFSYYLLQRKQRVNSTEPPEVAGRWPLLGHLHLLKGNRPVFKIFEPLIEKYGSIFIIYMGLKKTVVINKYQLARECLTEQDLATASRPMLAGGEIMGYNYAMFGLAPYGLYWRELRKIATLELLSSRRVEMQKYVRASEMKITLKELYQRWKKKKNSSGEAAVEMKQYFGELTLNVILRVIAGKRYYGESARASGMNEKEAEISQKALKSFFDLLIGFTVGDLVPCLGWLDYGGMKKMMKKTSKELDIIVSKWLDEHKQKSSDSSDEKDFMDVMISVFNNGSASLGGYDGDTIVKATCLSMILGGNDTTAATLIWALTRLLNEPYTLKKLQEELDQHVGRGRLVTESDLHKLVYLQSVLKETLRLHHVGGFLLRQVMKDCTLGGYHVSKDAWLLINLASLHTDPSSWPDEPLEFRPERFLSTNKNVDFKGQNFELLPFGAGRRVCPGLSMGVQTAQLALASLAHAFDIRSATTPIDMTESSVGTNTKATPLDVFIKPRLDLRLYEQHMQ